MLNRTGDFAIRQRHPLADARGSVAGSHVGSEIPKAVKYPRCGRIYLWYDGVYNLLVRRGIDSLKLTFCLLSVLLVCNSASAQTASLRGQITDESGAVIPSAKVTLNGPSRLVKTATLVDGSYSFVGLVPGDYTVQATAPELGLPQPVKIALKSGPQTLNLQLKVASTAQQVTVEANSGPTISTDAASNASALVLRGADLDALSDNPDDLQADLMALAGPAAGPGGGSIFIDGFSGGQLPSKESIREIRINANPFSPEYDKLGWPHRNLHQAGDRQVSRHSLRQLRRQLLELTRNPYAQQKAPFILKEYGGSVSGPLGKRASFFFDIRRDSVDNGAIINGITLDPRQRSRSSIPTPASFECHSAVSV